MTSFRLTQSLIHRIVGGVCGGIADYLGVSAWAIRAAFVVLTVVLPNLGIPLYILLWLVMPAQTLNDLPGTDRPRLARTEGILLLGAGIIAVGIFTLADTLGVLNGVKGDLLAPILLGVIALVLLVRNLRKGG